MKYPLVFCRNTHFACFLGLLLFLSPLPMVKALGLTAPIKIKIESNHSIEAGKSATINVTIVDADNNPAPTATDITITVHVLWSSGKEADFNVPIKSGATSAMLTVAMKAPGLCKFTAKEAQLLPANAFIIILNPNVQKTTVVRSMSLRRSPRMRGPDEAKSIDEPTPTMEVHSGGQDIIIMHSARSVLADGKDPAKIEAFMTTPANRQMQIRLHNTLGTLTSDVLTIPKDSVYGSTTLVSNIPGAANVSTPALVPCPHDVPFTVKFISPIVGIKCMASPPSISLIDNTDILVTLVDEHGNERTTDFPRVVSFAIDEGRGEFSKTELTIDSGRSQVRATFVPTKLGAMSITAMTPDLHSQKTGFSVSWPLMQLIFSILGGVAGGFIAKIRSNTEHWRILIGMVTGFVLYWAFIFGLLHVVSTSIALNPFSAFSISVLGGWLGTEVFSALLSQFGIIKKPA